ncbi:hypothetical protein ACFL2Q_06845 [Thermodesulfobacteriota bacterium]
MRRLLQPILMIGTFLVTMLAATGCHLLSPRCGPEWEFSPLGFRSGALAPKSPHQSIRMDSQEVIMRLEDNSYTIDAVFHFYNTGDSTTEWVRLPKRGMSCRRGRALYPEFIRLDTWIDGTKVQFAEERSLMRRAKDFFFPEASSPTRDSLRPELYNRWMAKRVTFPGRSGTSIRVSYDAEYVSGGGPPPSPTSSGAYYIVGTSSYWAGEIKNFVFTVDASQIGGTANLVGLSPLGLERITEDFARYELCDYEPMPEEVVGVSAQ